ncbi:MAG TPA: hypothetical protein VN207_11550 [Ktedonobacteraceae bacterium]|nr:hypothetical protein [Ktedonobacteraceae bacterium]
MSEVARLRAQIETETVAMRLAMIGFKMTASHEIITAAYDRLGAHQEQLGKLIGEQEAAKVVIMALGWPEQ